MNGIREWTEQYKEQIKELADDPAYGRVTGIIAQMLGATLLGHSIENPFDLGKLLQLIPLAAGIGYLTGKEEGAFLEGAEKIARGKASEHD